jgi:hypothetical protein
VTVPLHGQIPRLEIVEDQRITKQRFDEGRLRSMARADNCTR